VNSDYGHPVGHFNARNQIVPSWFHELEADVMFRIGWLAVICLVCVGALLMLRTSLESRAMADASASLFDSKAAPELEGTPPLPKADRLPSIYFDTTQKTVPVTTIRPTPSEANTPPVRKTREVVSWHWHVGSKITKGTAVVPDR
jgi:hypothetical protein